MRQASSQCFNNSSGDACQASLMLKSATEFFTCKTARGNDLLKHQSLMIRLKGDSPHIPEASFCTSTRRATTVEDVTWYHGDQMPWVIIPQTELSFSVSENAKFQE